MRPELLIWLTLFLPLAAAGVIALFTSHNRRVSATLSIGAVVAGFVLSAIYVKIAGWTPETREVAFDWLSIGQAFHAEFGLRLDALSLAMTLVVTGVAALIHIYSLGYMREDPGFSRFFASLSLFTFSMLGIVLSNNLLQLFICWELVGVSSYLLIGFWYTRASAADAAKKAFLTNRLGDLGFLIGILFAWATLGSLNFGVLQERIAADTGIWATTATLVGLLIFCGAVGKSAQFPLHVWLPDAMEGPTPVSALIHAATMVAAGVYMLCRVFFMLSAPALEVIAYVGGFTALLAAVIAIQQNDIKRILAYSTLSQLGYMVMAVGLSGAGSGPTPAMFHLTTHAFFKALLFLGAGSVIIALHHEQDIWNMGGLRKKTPVTYWTFLVGTLALAGLWPFSGFFSKDSILALALERHNHLLFLLGVFVAALTTFYMFRLVLVVFYGATRSEQAGHAHESPGVMAWPLRVLAVLSIIGGVIGIDALYARHFNGAQSEHAAGFISTLFAPFAHSWVASVAGLIAVAVGFFAALKLYAGADKDPLPHRFPAASRWMRNRFYLDELYEATVIRLHDFIAAVAGWVDRWVIEGFAVGLVRGGTDLAGRALRLLQTGNLQTYAFLFALGVALVLFFALGR
ncbi:MAG TPA: NADH-quinone oxidoreductase subunit L [Verrucomicrobia bacterium]|nr:NADH-quinone oxidoreductase subunit L [Verrucomicrobiota bacterium]HOP98314.1 NADH-quinone oxidoreductase subunit L [Verrucomicrobiota bacterium]HPU54705.1 NADH-quinone oxidoreductase subunit L [Verrucomicrobiota bacterium]